MDNYIGLDINNKVTVHAYFYSIGQRTQYQIPIS